MSPTPSPSPEDIDSLVKDGFIASLLGSMAMMARILLSTEPVSVGWVLRRLLAASITAVLVGYGIKDQIQSESLRFFVIGGCGYTAPEITDYFIRWVKARGETELKKVETKDSRGKRKKK